MPSGRDDAGGLSYAACRGDLWIDWNWNEGRGLFGHGAHTLHKISSITDGTSNTIVVSEAVIGPGGTSSKIKGGSAGNLPKPTNVGPPGECLARRGASESLTGTIAGNYGRRWGDARTIFSQFFTILPPNSPSCTSGNNAESWLLRSASSEHTGGVNCLVGDGAVTFVSDSVSTANLNKTPADIAGIIPDNIRGNPQWYNGPSMYGIWGSLGTIAGGEQASIP